MNHVQVYRSLQSNQSASRPSSSPRPRRHPGSMYVPAGSTIIINQLEQRSLFSRMCRSIGLLALMALVSIWGALYTVVELDYLVDPDRVEAAQGQVSFCDKVMRSLNRRGIYVEWRGLFSPRLYRIQKVYIDRQSVKHDSNGAYYLPYGDSSFRIYLLRDEGGYYSEEEFTLYPLSEEGNPDTLEFRKNGLG